MRARIATGFLAMLLVVVAAPALGEPAPSADRAYVDAVLDGLVSNGVISADQAAAIKADAAKTAQTAADKAKAQAAPAPAPAQPPKKAWYDTMKISGYTQARFLYYPDYPNADRKDKGSDEFTVRRGRVTLDFTPSQRAEVYFQADYADGEPGLKDAWIQYGLDDAGCWRVRLGQQKIPFGFDPCQSDPDRLPMERNWLDTWTFPGNRDTGAVFYYTRRGDRDLFAAGKKADFGSGDFGSLAVGVMNGQGAAYRALDAGGRAFDGTEVNSQKHIVLRVARPLSIGDARRYGEVGASYWAGTYHSTKAARDFDDRLFGLHAYLAPRPLGLQAEYQTGETEGAGTSGWYGMGLLRTGRRGLLFARYENYDGPRKGKGAGNRADRERTSLGYARQLDDRTRLTLEYDLERVEAQGDKPAYGNDLLGLQLQATY